MSARDRRRSRGKGRGWAVVYLETGSLYHEFPAPLEVAELGQEVPASEADSADPFPSRANEGEPRDFVQIGKALGLTPERIRQIHNEALSKLRERFDKQPPSTAEGTRGGRRS